MRMFGKKNIRRWEEKISTKNIIRTFGRDYKCIFVGDASMSPYEILVSGGGNEYFNEETGEVWFKRITEHWSSYLWINPIVESDWKLSESTAIIQRIFKNRMVPLNQNGIKKGIKILSKK